MAKQCQPQKKKLQQKDQQKETGKGAVKARRSDIGLFQPVLPDTSPPTPDRNDYWPPHPVVPADNNFIKPHLLPKPKLPAKPQLPPKLLLDEFPRPLTKTIVAKKNKIKLIPKKEVSINETSLSEKLTKIFRNIDEVEKEKQDDKKYVEEVKNRTEILSKAGEDETPFEFEFFTRGKKKILMIYVMVQVFPAMIQNFQIFYNPMDARKYLCQITLKFIFKLVIFTMTIMIQINQFLIFFQNNKIY